MRTSTKSPSLVVAALLFGSTTNGFAADQPAPQPAVPQAAPAANAEEVFQRYQAALSQGALLDVFHCFDAARQREGVMEAVVQLGLIHGEEKKAAIRQQFPLDDAKLQARYEELYQAKHKIDYRAARLAREAKWKELVPRVENSDGKSAEQPIAATPVAVPANFRLPELPPYDGTLMEEVINASIAQPAKFYAAVFALKSPQPGEIPQKLRIVARDANTATGIATTQTQSIFIDAAGKQAVRHLDVPQTIHFTRGADGWKISRIQ